MTSFSRHDMPRATPPLQWQPEVAEQMSADLMAFNPYTSTGPKHEEAVDRLVSLVKSIQV